MLLRLPDQDAGCESQSVGAMPQECDSSAKAARPLDCSGMWDACTAHARVAAGVMVLHVRGLASVHMHLSSYAPDQATSVICLSSLRATVRAPLQKPRAAGELALN